MSQQDSFINEVSEEVRRDRLYALMRRYGWIAVLLVVLLVGGAAWFEYRKASREAAAQATGDALLAALSEETPEARLAAIEAAGPGAGPEQAAVIGLLQAAAAEEAGDAEAAAAALDRVAEMEGVPSLYRDLAVLKRVITGAGSLDAGDRKSRLQPLMQPGNPFRLLALEQSALAEIGAGETDAAISTLEGIVADQEATEDLRQRARRLIVALGGTLDAG